MSLPPNAEAPTESFSVPAVSKAEFGAHDGTVKLVSSTSTDSSDSSVRSGASTRAESVLKAADFSADTVTCPLEALALACVAERESSEEQEQQQSSSSSSSGKKDFTENDVLCGRGGLTNNAAGNIFFRSLVRQKQELYLKASKREKAGVAREIVEAIRSHGGRFLKKDSKGVWVEIGDRKAREKTSQALREGAPELRQKTLAQTAPPPALGAVNVATMTHVIDPTSAPPMFHPRKFFKPDPTSVWMPANRARVVSDDSVGIAGPLMQEACAGSKRKVQDDAAACAMQEKRHQDDGSENGASSQRGPRLKLLKSRLMV